MKKIIWLSFIFLFFSFFLVNYAEARSGCCSHHGGYCGCKSGTAPLTEVKETIPLTAVREVAPSINETKQTLNLDDNVNKVKNNTSAEKTSPAPIQSNQSPVSENKTSESDDGYFFNFLLILGLAGFIIYSAKKKKGKKIK